ncbi:efflux RND transporter periplasmic adaptor subunit [Paucibacter sp. B51]|uniref:efflux RND transporter periplasmic adaptor subunit n=1 Tax=Paucibacter sp. B51 TaxID=2993315 RepID=UPI0022EBB81D|nr:efflux RND transporter periplasmic adaptor subunit [Paucibacter sp. B51]
MHFTKKLLLGLLLGLVLAAGLGFGLARTKQPSPIAIVHTIDRGPVHAEFQAQGSFLYAEQARLSPEFMARVLKVHVREGDLVRAQQLLLELDPALQKLEAEQVNAQLAQAQAKLAQSQLAWRQAQEKKDREAVLWRDGMSFADRWSDAQLKEEDARLGVEAAKQHVRQIAAQRERTQELVRRAAVLAPIGGRVIRIGIKPGETAVPSATSLAGSDLLVLADPDSLEVEALVAEQDLARIHQGQPIKARAVAFPEVLLTGRVKQISPAPKPLGPAPQEASKMRPVAVRIALDRVPAELKPRLWSDMAADVSFGAGGKDAALRVPLLALRHEEESALSSMEAAAFGTRQRPYVWLLRAGQAEKRLLVLGMADAEHQEVIEGLSAGDQIVAGPPELLDRLRSGQALAGPRAP